MKVLIPFITFLLISFSSFSQENIKELTAYQDVHVTVESDFNPSIILVLEEKEYDKLLLGERLRAFLEMNDFKVASIEVGNSSKQSYLMRYNYEYMTDNKKCGGTIIKSMNGNIIDMQSDKVMATFNFEPKRNKTCSDEIVKVLAYKLKSGS
jgi:hypothetical protein